MSHLSDSDDSDNDFLFQKRIFAKPKSEKRELTPIHTLERIASGKAIASSKDGTEESTERKRKRMGRTNASNKKRKPKKAKAEKSKNEVLRAQKLKDPGWVEAQARKTVDEVLRLDVVDEVTDLNDIGWYSYASKKGKATEYYPVIVSQNKAEAKVLLKSRPNRNYKTKKIQYIGVKWRYASTHEEIALSKWIPFSSSSEAENEERLQNFVKSISKTSLFKNDPLGLKIEEFAVRKMWDKVRKQKDEQEVKEEEERAEVPQTAGKIDPSAAIVPLLPVTQDSDNNSQHGKEKRVDDSDDSDDDDDDHTLSPGKKETKRMSVRVNDEIEYYELIGTFGNPDSLRRDTVVGIRPNNSSYPLILSNDMMQLPGTHRVRRLPDGFWQPINDFVLLQEGIQSVADCGSGLNEATRKMRAINSEIAKARDDFWMNGQGASENDEKMEDCHDCCTNKQNAKKNTGVVNNCAVPSRRSRRSSARKEK